MDRLPEIKLLHNNIHQVQTEIKNLIIYRFMLIIKLINWTVGVFSSPHQRKDCNAQSTTVPLKP